jgi:hypothetical protein
MKLQHEPWLVNECCDIAVPSLARKLLHLNTFKFERENHDTISYKHFMNPWSRGLLWECDGRGCWSVKNKQLYKSVPFFCPRCSLFPSRRFDLSFPLSIISESFVTSKPETLYEYIKNET